jgi:hypothetical protein
MLPVSRGAPAFVYVTFCSPPVRYRFSASTWAVNVRVSFASLLWFLPFNRDLSAALERPVLTAPFYLASIYPLAVAAG